MTKKLLDPVRAQIGLRIRQRKGTTIPRELLQYMVRKWAEGERLPRGVEVKFINWQNPTRNKKELRKWRHSTDEGQSLEAARKTLARLLQRAEIHFV